MSNSIAVRLFQDDSFSFYSPCKHISTDDADLSFSPMTEYLHMNQTYNTPLRDEDSRDSGIDLDDTPTATILTTIDTSRPFSAFSQVKMTAY